MTLQGLQNDTLYLHHRFPQELFTGIAQQLIVYLPVPGGPGYWEPYLGALGQGVTSTLQLYKLRKKINVLSLSTAFIFSKLNVCKYLCEHNKIQQLRYKLNKFHRHVTNRN